MNHRIVAVSGRPDLAPLVARWRVEAFFNIPGDWTVEEMTARILAPPEGPKETFVLFEDDQPVGTAGLVQTDLPSRADLTPWLAEVFVEPDFRGRGYASRLVRRVEDFALAASVSVLWLYTETAEPLYARLGWQRVGTERDRGHDVTLMRRDLSGSGA
jgi:GNAT superfamily N-acetyltransferase